MNNNDAFLIGLLGRSVRDDARRSAIVSGLIARGWDPQAAEAEAERQVPDGVTEIFHGMWKAVKVLALLFAGFWAVVFIVDGLAAIH